jgi:hypothetical protein
MGESVVFSLIVLLAAVVLAVRFFKQILVIGGVIVFAGVLVVFVELVQSIQHQLQ